MMDHELFVCQCSDIEHQLVVSYFPDYPDDDTAAYLQIHLCSFGFWKRMWVSLKYIIGKKSRYGHGAFAEVLLDADSALRLSAILKERAEKINDTNKKSWQIQ